VVRAEFALEVDVRPWCAVTSHRLDPVEGGALWDLGSQVVDLATWLLALEPVEVRAVGQSRRRPGDSVRIDLVYQGGAVARCQVGYGAPTGERVCIEGEHGRIRMADPNKRVHVERGRTAPWSAVGDLATLGWRGVFRSRSMSRRSIELAIGAFVQAITRSAPFSPGFAEASQSTRLLEAAARSMELGTAVDPRSLGYGVVHG
jgi:predicted dehydrogenase